MRKRFRGSVSHLTGDLVVGTEESPGPGAPSGNNPTTAAANVVHLFGRKATLPPGIESLGDDTNVDLAFAAQGAAGWAWANGGGAAQQGGQNSTYELAKTVTGIADNVATAVFTVTVPNAPHTATIALTLTASLGAGGAVGAFEANATAYGQIIVSRRTGLATVATAAALTSTASAAVAGAATITLAYALSGMTGGNGATQTFTINVTITRGSGTSTNHQVVLEAVVWNANANGITIA